MGVVSLVAPVDLVGGSLSASIGGKVTLLCGVSVPGGVVVSRTLLHRRLVSSGGFFYHGDES